LAERTRGGSGKPQGQLPINGTGEAWSGIEVKVEAGSFDGWSLQTARHDWQTLQEKKNFRRGVRVGLLKDDTSVSDLAASKNADR
jgi:hypothetical protein